nr:MAG TPA: protein of unknown function (DUF5337) [Caudoviricetes sp.]
MDLQNIAFLGFVGGWLGGFVWALVATFRANRKEKE